jgi:hypothetical protein
MVFQEETPSILFRGNQQMNSFLGYLFKLFVIQQTVCGQRN